MTINTIHVCRPTHGMSLVYTHNLHNLVLFCFLNELLLQNLTSCLSLCFDYASVCPSPPSPLFPSSPLTSLVVSPCLDLGLCPSPSPSLLRDLDPSPSPSPSLLRDLDPSPSPSPSLLRELDPSPSPSPYLLHDLDPSPCLSPCLDLHDLGPSPCLDLHDLGPSPCHALCLHRALGPSPCLDLLALCLHRALDLLALAHCCPYLCTVEQHNELCTFYLSIVYTTRTVH